MNRQTSKTIILIIAAATLLVSAILLIVLPKSRVSENENRYLAKFPDLTRESIFSGDAMEEIEIYINDHFPFRDFLVGIQSNMDKLIGKKELNGIYICEDEFLIQSYEGYDADAMDRHVNILNEFSDTDSYTTYFMLAPTSSGIYHDKKPKHNTDESQIESIKAFYEGLQSITPIDVHTALNNQKENQLYFRLDHHWNADGAYIAYAKFCSELSIEPYAKDDFDAEIITEDFCGTYYSKSTYYGFAPDTIERFTPKFEYDYTVEYIKENEITDTLYNEEHLNTKDKYAYFLDGNHSQIKIVNSAVDDGSKILIAKDSYANIFIPFLVNHYSEVYVIDMRFFTQPLSEYAVENGIDTVLFLYNVDTVRDDIGILRVG